MESVMPTDAVGVITGRTFGVSDPTAPGINVVSDVASDRQVSHHKELSTLRL